MPHDVLHWVQHFFAAGGTHAGETH
jgi:hypothetical protein